MNRSVIILLGALGLVGCGASNQVGQDEAGYLNAELKVIPMRYFVEPVSPGTTEVFALQEDGTVVAKGKPVARIADQRVLSPSGEMLIAVTPDGGVTGPRAPRGAHFNAKNHLVTDNAELFVQSNEVVGRRVREVQATPFGDARLVLRSGSKTVVVVGHYESFNGRATRAAILLGSLLLMKPGTLDQPPAG